MARELTQQLRAYSPEVVVGVVKGGLFVGSAVAGLLGCEFIPVRLSSRSRDHGTLRADVRTAIPREVKGKRVLVVDDVMQSGETLRRAMAKATAAGASEVRAATLVIHPKRSLQGGRRPDWFALETEDLVVFPWDYELRGGGMIESDPETSGA